VASMRALRALREEDPAAHKEVVSALQSMAVQISALFDHLPPGVLNRQEIRQLSNIQDRLGKFEQLGHDAEEDHGIDHYAYNPR
tara:strand:+ start:1428 stop:1679 length:252 start_codon:yes stop_codon:yes gene_type:complete